jgi:myo-inositol-1(or 4)-monophosphatase
VTGVGSTEPEGAGAGFAGAGAGTDWLSVCRGAVEDVRAVILTMPTRVEREPVLRAGLGGDDTTAIDQAAEDAILARFADLDVTIVSEEAGRFGTGSTIVVVDPIDGSLNAKRGIPFFSLSIAVAEGETMGDVFFGYVYDFGTGEEWIGRRGEGATLNGAPLGGVKPKERIEILSFEATRTSLVAEHAASVAHVAHRLRIMGSLALSLCHLAAGRVDGVCSLKAARSVDIAAAQLLCREVGIVLELFDDPRAFGDAELDLTGRSRIAAAGTAALCSQVAAALSA